MHSTSQIFPTDPITGHDVTFYEISDKTGLFVAECETCETLERMFTIRIYDML